VYKGGAFIPWLLLWELRDGRSSDKYSVLLKPPGQDMLIGGFFVFGDDL
jgi:hypothetical protein